MIRREDILAAPFFRQQALIGGLWSDSETGATFPVTDPATGEVIAQVADCSPGDAERAIEAANAAWPDWKNRTAKDRADVLRRWFDLVKENRPLLAGLMSLEQGKPLREAEAEVDYGAGYIEWFAEEARRTDGAVIPAHAADLRLLVLRQPVGVVAAITPWNFPIAMITRKVAPALAAGCTVVVKPASLTPLCALALGHLAALAGIPEGVLSIIPSRSSSAIGKVLTQSPLVRKVSFTGSTEIGRLLLAQSAGTIKKVSMELGGNAPVLVFDDADIDKAIAGTLAAKFRNAGQTCVCANRIYVQSGIYDAFAERLAVAVRQLSVGPALEDAFDQGPLIDGKAVEKVEELVADAVSIGGRVLTGGKRHSRGQTFYEPTVIADATQAMKIAREEVFGPVAPLFRFDTEDEAVAMANDTEFGLASYMFSRDLGRIFRVAERIEAGMVGINTGLISTEVAPFGGVKQSGLGREGSRVGIDDYTELKYLCLDVS
ncbi:NAD-dependent succinate-semialdehyde dehydrogenase [Cypionkella sp.]|uniref:NAD-dependent succinate-semialdehyde dehydrogenase n=1 Tax=Cypionkella sp. TaxID=2811411 RepID=UPI002ABB575C|nr:NAD-dependent succinate-semialdehyde dehydrogenase [Cypionkella sp.]MDZ4393200.1 NAD-dependent succinate-semialdehyde dehydrogenase [Cypionkella sp.]